MSFRLSKRFLGIAVAGVICSLAFQQIAAAATTEQVDDAIKKAVEFLYSKQTGDNWEPPVPANVPPGKQPPHHTGYTAIAIYSLLAAGESPASSPKLKAAIEWLKKNETTNIYALGMRAQVWNLIPHDKDQSVIEAIKNDYELLLEGARKAKGPGYRGLYHYAVSDRDYDASCSQYGVLGVWALEQAGREVPDAYWNSVEDAWQGIQMPDGGWGYGKNSPTTITMTAAGIATLFITQDYLRSNSGISCKGNTVNEPIAKGMEWMERALPDMIKSGKGAGQWTFYMWYGIERIGVASGYKYFGTLDWYKEGADYLIKSATKNTGGWGSIPNTAFGMLFLSRGRAPVVMNKLKYSVDGKEANWNQRPRDAANAVKYVAKQMERDLNWQIVNLDVDVEQLHDSPILYIAGNQALKFSDTDQAKLKKFVEQGGMILGNADCGDDRFAKSFKALGMKLFPNAGEFRKLEVDHPIYTRQQFLAKNWRDKPNLQGLSNHVRELMLLVPAGDPGKAWQLADNKSKESMFQMLSNIFLYSVEGKDLRFKGSTYLVTPDPKIKASKTIKVARLDAGENPDPEPGGWVRLSAEMHNSYGIDVDAQMVKLDTDALKDYKIAHLTGTGKIKLKDEQQKALKAFVEGGGTLVIDAAGGDADFSAAIEEMLHAQFGDDANQLANSIASDHALFAAGEKPLGEFLFRSFARGRVPRGQASPLLRGMTLKNRLAVIMSREDLSAGMVGNSVDGITGYTPRAATLLMQKSLIYASGGAKPLSTGPQTPAKPTPPPAKPAAPAQPAKK